MRARTLILFLLTACLAAAASIDGTWTSEMKVKGGKQGGERTVHIKLDLKARGELLTGTVASGARQRHQSVRIQDGKLEGNQFSFTTVRNSKKKGEQKITWRGTIEGDTLQGTRSAGGKRRGQSFTARRG